MEPDTAKWGACFLFQNKLELGRSLRILRACALFQSSPQVRNSLETFCLFTGKEGAAFCLSHFAIKTKDSEVQGRAQESLSPHQHCDGSFASLHYRPWHSSKSDYVVRKCWGIWLALDPTTVLMWHRAWMFEFSAPQTDLELCSVVLSCRVRDIWLLWCGGVSHVGFQTKETVGVPCGLWGKCRMTNRKALL